MNKLDALQKKLGVSFKDRTLLEQALTHSSYINENPGKGLTSNERLEFLGDAVLGLVIAEKLYQEMAQASEGELTRLRASFIKRDVLARTASAIGLGDYLCLGKGEEASGGRQKPANLAGALEALVAAIFLDQGLPSAREFILNLFSAELDKLSITGKEKDYKSLLQELLQARQQVTPVYQTVEAAGPAHARTFTVEVKASDMILGRGSGKSKKLAETEAARAALERLPASFTE